MNKKDLKTVMNFLLANEVLGQPTEYRDYVLKIKQEHFTDKNFYKQLQENCKVTENNLIVAVLSYFLKLDVLHEREHGVRIYL